MNVDYYVLPDKLDNAKTDFSNHVKMLEVFSKLFGEYPFIKEKYGVAEFLWYAGAMEHQTITGVSSNMISGKKFLKILLFTNLRISGGAMQSVRKAGKISGLMKVLHHIVKLFIMKKYLAKKHCVLQC